MLSKQNQAVLLMAITKAVNDKPNPQPKLKPKKVLGDGNPNDGKAEWVRFKSECVLLKGRSGK